MRRLISLGVLLSLACAGTLYFASTTPAQAAPDAVIECVRTQLKELNYEQKAYDAQNHRIVVQHRQEGTRRPDANFRAVVDRIQLQAYPSPSGGSDVKLDAHTFGVYETNRGSTDDEEKASDSVLIASQAILDSCGK